MFLRIFSVIYSTIRFVFLFIYNGLLLAYVVLPYGLEWGLLGVASYYWTKLKAPDPASVMSVFGPELGSKEAEDNPESVVQCIAHRGAALDAPENTLEAFKYCVERECNFVELDVRTVTDGRLVVLHDEGLQRISNSTISEIFFKKWEDIKDIDIGVTHPNRRQFGEVKLCLLDTALDFLLANRVRVIIDAKGDNTALIDNIVNTFASRPGLHQHVAVTCFNPITLHKIRSLDANIVGAISYRPYCFSYLDFDAEHGPFNLRYHNVFGYSIMRAIDALHSLLWRYSVTWCGASAVLLHKDIVSPREVGYWRSLGIRCVGWCVNRPTEKLYWRTVLRAPYLSNTLTAERDRERQSGSNDRSRANSLQRDTD